MLSQVKRLRSPEIDSQFEFRRLLDRQVGGLGFIETLDDERCRASAQIGVSRQSPAAGTGSLKSLRAL
jgi:hypothetical protein